MDKLLMIVLQLNSLTWEEISTENVYYAPLVRHPYSHVSSKTC